MKLDSEQIARRRYFKQFVKESDLGLEIGAGYRPTFRKDEGWNVVVMDHLPTIELRNKYRELKLPENFLEAIEVVDIVWNGEPYSKLLKNHPKFDFIIASHVIEHSKSVLEFLSETSKILADDGILLLVVPDKVAMFDFYRPLTTIGDVILGEKFPEAYDTKAWIDEELLRCKFGRTITWSRKIAKRFMRSENLPYFVTPQAEVEALLKLILENNQSQKQTYRDGHRWVFTPNSLKHIIEFLGNCGMINFEVKEYRVNNTYEFFMVLRKVKQRSKIEEVRESYRKELLPSSRSIKNSKHSCIKA